MFLLMFINSFAQGIGYPTSSKIISANTESSKEQNAVITIWSLGQNIGGGLMSPLSTYIRYRYY
jgi:sugar phosphate permease